jgi:phosphate:Na+ symporter
VSPDAAVQQIAWGALVAGLLGGLALFLFGMEQMTGALKHAAGSGMRSLLAGLTRNRFLALFTGAFVTAVIQSSSVTTVLVVGFISAGLMSLPQSVGIIIGANVGTTITAQIIAFKVTQYALVLIAAGFGANFLARTDRVRQIGAMAMGLGLVFFGMGLMSDATSPLRGYAPFIEAMGSMQRPIFGIAAAAAFTALVQSSSATTGIVIVLASQGFITSNLQNRAGSCQRWYLGSVF